MAFNHPVIKQVIKYSGIIAFLIGCFIAFYFINKTITDKKYQGSGFYINSADLENRLHKEREHSDSAYQAFGDFRGEMSVFDNRYQHMGDYSGEQSLFDTRYELKPQDLVSQLSVKRPDINEPYCKNIYVRRVNDSTNFFVEGDCYNFTKGSRDFFSYGFVNEDDFKKCGEVLIGRDGTWICKNTALKRLIYFKDLSLINNVPGSAFL